MLTPAYELLDDAERNGATQEYVKATDGAERDGAMQDTSPKASDIEKNQSGLKNQSKMDFV